MAMKNGVVSKKMPKDPRVKKRTLDQWLRDKMFGKLPEVDPNISYTEEEFEKILKENEAAEAEAKKPKTKPKPKTKKKPYLLRKSKGFGKLESVKGRKQAMDQIIKESDFD